MNASLLAALASPPGKTPAMKAATKPKRAESAIAAGASKSNNKENRRLQAGSAAAKGGDAEVFSPAPAFTVTETPSAPGRMENLRVLIEEGKKAAAEGRLAAALRKYETAMVTLPEAYKPRLRNKIAKLEARLDEEEDRCPGTPACSSSKSSVFPDGADTLEKDPGPLDLLHIAVQDVTAAAVASGRDTGALSTFSPRRSSPLVRGLGSYGRVITSVSDAGELSTPPLREAQGGEEEEEEEEDDGQQQQQQQQHDADLDDDTGLEDGLASRLIRTLESAATKEGQGSSTPRGGARGCDGRRSVVAEGAGVSTGEEEASLSSGKGGDDEPFGLGAAVVDDDDAEVEGAEKQERMRAINRGLSDKLEKQVVAIMNEASSQDLTELHGIGLRRAQLIIQTRTAAPFETLADLSRIGMYPKQIEKMGRHNMLECLDVYPAKTRSP